MVESLVHFTQSAHIWLRENNRISIGLLPQTAVSFPCLDQENPELLVRNLWALQRQQNFYLPQLEAALAHAGMALDRISDFIHDCSEYGIISPVPESPSVAVLADAQSTSALRMLLEPQGVSVLSPSPSALGELAPSIPLVSINKFQMYRQLTVSARTSRTMIPVTAADGHVLIGPVFLHGQGPCPLCLELNHLRADEAWHEATTRYGEEDCLTPILRTTMAAHTAALIAQVLGQPQDRLGQHQQIRPGFTVHVDVFRHTVSTEEKAANPQCPECFERAGRQAEGMRAGAARCSPE